MRRLLTAVLRLLTRRAPPPGPDSIAAPGPGATPAPMPDTRATWGHVAKAHARRLTGCRDEALLPAPGPLPPDVHRWIYRLDMEQLRFLGGPRVPAWLVERHVLAGARGPLHSLGYVLPERPPATVQGGDGGRDGRSGKGGVRLEASLQDLVASLQGPGGPRMR